MRPRKGQVWSSDFAMSIGVFSIAAVIAFTIILNTFDEREYESARQQANGAAALLAGEGYPVHWVDDTVIRAGITSNGRVSMRKVGEVAGLDALELRRALRTTDNTYVYFTSDGDTVSLFGTCGIGDMTVPSVAQNWTLPAVAIAPLGAALTNRLNVAASTGDAVYTNLSRQDIIIIEGGVSSNHSDDEIARNIHEAARNGITIIVVGDPQVPLLGIAVNATTPAVLEVEEGLLQLQTGEEISVAGLVPTIEEPNSTAIDDLTVIARTPDGKIAYATWIYDDARVWYLATVGGQHANGTPVADTLGNATNGMLVVPRPTCANVTVPDAKQVATHTRTVTYHDELLDLHVLVWRE